MIPRVLHYVWVGPRALPDADRRRIARWRQLHPDWEIRAWGNDDVDLSSPYVRGAFALRAWNRVSDYMRMDALARYGGVYLDTDFDVLRPLDPFRECEAFLGFQIGDEIPGELVAGGLFGAAPGHWLSTAIRDHFDEHLDGRRDLNSYTGPGIVTEMLRSRGLQGYSDEPIDVAGVRLLPKRYFYPYSWQETFSEDVITPDTYAVHRWAATWVDDRPTRARRARRTLLQELGDRAPALALTISRTSARVGVHRRLRALGDRRAVAPRPSAPIAADLRAELEPLFDAEHYRRHLPRDVADPLAHYVSCGWTLGLDPHPAFSTGFYLAGDPPLAEPDVCPLVRYVTAGAAAGRQPHALFDVDFYRSQAGDVADPLLHYLRVGWRDGLDPHPLFSTRSYLDANGDVSASGACPLVHYLAHGGAEDRQPHPLFDPRFYRTQATSLAPGENPLVHYVMVGGHHHRDPSRWFDTQEYLAARPDVAQIAANPLVHYVRFGWREGSNPHRDFDVDRYFADRPELQRSCEPVSHHLAASRLAPVVGADPEVARFPATIVIPLFRQRDEWLETSVRSALAQTVACEVVVVISPMTPRSNVAVLARLDDGTGRLVVCSQQRPGFAAALNTGIERSSAARVGFLLSDDWLEPWAVEECLRSPADIVSTGRRCYAEDGEHELVDLGRRVSRAEYLALPTLEEQADYLTHFFLIRRDLLRAVGGVDESLGDTPGLDDYDLVWTLLERQATVDVVERFAYNYRDHRHERLTLRDPGDMGRTMDGILSKHGLTGSAREALLAQKALWFGRPMHAVARSARSHHERPSAPDAAPSALAVCVLLFERPYQTLECLESVGDAGVPIYVLNNGSSAGSREVVAQFARDRRDIRLIDVPANVGVARGRNRLIEAAAEELLLFLDSDITVQTPEWSAILGARAQEWPEIDVLVPRLLDVRTGRVDGCSRIVINGDRFMHVPSRDGAMNWFPGGAACVRRTLFERLGSYDESMFVGLEDYELAVRALRERRPIRARGVDEVVLHHDHRPARTEDDVHAARTRYSTTLVREAHEHIVARHGVRYDEPWEGWTQQQLDAAIGGHGRSPAAPRFGGRSSVGA